MFENRMVKEILWPKSEEVIDSWRKLKSIPREILGLRAMKLEKSMLREIFAPKSEKVMEGWRKWHREGCCDLNLPQKLLG
jgi:hypothetical protein